MSFLGLLFVQGSIVFFRSDPLRSLSVLPSSISDFLFGVVINTYALLFPVHPEPIILTSIRPCEYTVTLFLVIEIFSLIFSSIGPGEDTCSVHFVIYPISRVFSVIGPSIFTVTMNVIIDKSTAVRRFVSP